MKDTQSLCHRSGGFVMESKNGSAYSERQQGRNGIHELPEGRRPPYAGAAQRLVVLGSGISEAHDV